MVAASARFVAAADEVWRLQRADEPECRWFRRVVRGATDPVAGSMQGTYVITASGALLGRINSHDPDRVLAMLAAALKRWSALPAAQRAAPAPQSATPGHRWEDSYPTGGLALQRWARDVGSAPTGEPRSPVNQDAVWFAADELGGFAPSEGVVGACRAVDPQLIARLARFAFVDNVRGQTLPFSSKALTVASMQSVVAAVDGDVWTLHFTGQTAATTDGTDPGEAYWRSARAWPRSLAVKLAGEARWDAAARRFSSFELVAIGSRSGRTTFNGRAQEEPGSEHGIGFLLQIAPSDHRVAPTYVNLYGAPWVKMPE
ncbi:MAG: hypothetical protein VXY92_10795 [Planctomycetota bacterium]|nr:hypothetical protein [Planctomycetota bacterium]